MPQNDEDKSFYIDDSFEFDKFSNSLKTLGIKDSIIKAMSSSSFIDRDVIIELLDMSAIDRAKVLKLERHDIAFVTDTKFKDIVKKVLFKGCDLGGTTYVDVMVYNLSKDGRIKEIPDALMESYQVIIDFSIFLGGFDFVAVSLIGTMTNFYQELAAFLLYIAFYLACFSAMTSLCCKEYLRSTRNEDEMFILEGLNRYKALYRMVTMAAFISLILLGVSINVQAHDSFKYVYFIIIEDISLGIMAVMLFTIFIFMTLQKQVYKHSKRKLYDARDTTIVDDNLDLV